MSELRNQIVKIIVRERNCLIILFLSILLYS